MPAKKIKLGPGQISQIEAMAGLGLKVEQMAAILGISKKTFERRMVEKKEVIDALERGRSIAANNVTKTAYEMAKSGKIPSMTMFWLKCRQNWREVQSVELTGRDGKPLEVIGKSEFTDEQLDERIRKLTLKP